MIAGPLDKEEEMNWLKGGEIAGSEMMGFWFAFLFKIQHKMSLSKGTCHGSLERGLDRDWSLWGSHEKKKNPQEIQE